MPIAPRRSTLALAPALAVALTLALPAVAAERARVHDPLPRARVQAAPSAPRAACASPDGPQPDGTVRCEMCPAAPGSRVQYRPMACTDGKWTEAGPCADGDCAGRTY